MALTRFFVWIDCEMTGIDWHLDHVLEIGVVVTKAFYPCEEKTSFESLILPEDPNWKSRMNDFVLNMHKRNNLLQEIENRGRPIREVEEEIIDIMKALGPPNCFMMAGSAISHCDRRFVEKQMPELNKWLKPEMHDVSVFRRGFVFSGRKDLDAFGQTFTEGGKPHRALGDVRDHLNEWRQYASMIESLPKETS